MSISEFRLAGAVDILAARPASVPPASEHDRDELSGQQALPEVTMSLARDSLQPYFGRADEYQRLAWTGGHELAVILDAALTGGVSGSWLSGPTPGILGVSVLLGCCCCHVLCVP